ncbi:holo-[acyl-carrier-protein] synthase [Desulfovulcanus sp.]
MILGLGLDVVEIERISRSYAKFKDRLVYRILTPKEIENLPQNPVSYLASRFAAKEAGVKALGTGFAEGITFQHLEIKSSKTGQPHLYFLGPAYKKAMSMGCKKIHLSITHSQNTAAAVVILEG